MHDDEQTKIVLIDHVAENQQQGEELGIIMLLFRDLLMVRRTDTL